MPVTAHYKDFINQLTQQLQQGHNWMVESETDEGSGDLVVKDPSSGKRIFIEFQNGGQYGELPISSVVSLNKQKNRLSGKDILFLVAFSAIPALLENKLRELGIMSIAKPSVEDVVGRVKYAMLA